MRDVACSKRVCGADWLALTCTIRWQSFSLYSMASKKSSSVNLESLRGVENVCLQMATTQHSCSTSTIPPTQSKAVTLFALSFSRDLSLDLSLSLVTSLSRPFATHRKDQTDTICSATTSSTAASRSSGAARKVRVRTTEGFGRLNTGVSGG